MGIEPPTSWTAGSRLTTTPTLLDKKNEGLRTPHCNTQSDTAPPRLATQRNTQPFTHRRAPPQPIISPISLLDMMSVHVTTAVRNYSSLTSFIASLTSFLWPRTSRDRFGKNGKSFKKQFPLAGIDPGSSCICWSVKRQCDTTTMHGLRIVL